MDDLLNHPEDAQAMDIDSDDSYAEYPPSTYTVRRRPRREASGLRFTRRRELGGTVIASPELITWIEGQTLRRLDLGRYIDLDRNAQLVRSTISIAFSHDGRFFASTHGDHSVKVFEYPTGKQISCLDGHPRTPWTVRFHPHDSSIIASGCLGSECRVWNVLEQKCIRKHTFRASISCVSFSPDGSLLAVTSGRSLLLWDYNEATAFGGKSTVFDSPGPGVPRELLGGNNPFHMVDFHPSGTMLMTGEKNRPPNTGRDHAQSSSDQFTLKLVIHRFDRRTGLDSSAPLLTVPRAVAYNDAGIHFSPCGTMLVACIPRQEDPNAFRIAVMSLARDHRLGKCLYSTELDKGHVTALTNLKFSSTSEHILAGFSFRPLNPVLRAHAEQYDANTSDGSTNNGSGFHGSGTSCIPRKPQVRVVDIYRVDEKFEMIRSLSADMDISEANVGGGGAEDEINVAVFAPVSGVADGIIYGTQKGRIRMFQIATGKAWRHQSGCDNNCSNDVMCIEPSNCFPDTHTTNTHSTPEPVESSSDTETPGGESSE